MKILFTAAAVFAALPLSACNWSSIGFNAKCKQDCAIVTITENESEADIDSAMKRECETMGRHGTPRVLDKSKTGIGFTCPE